MSTLPTPLKRRRIVNKFGGNVLKIRIVSAIGGDVLDLDVPREITVRDLRRQVAQSKKIPESTVLLVFRGKQLEDSQTLEEVGIGEYDKVFLIVRTTGG